MSNESILAFEGFSGRIGRYSFQRRNGRSLVRPRTRPKSTPTEDQLAVRSSFQAAASYARETARDPVARVPYEAVAASRNISVYQAAMADKLRKPKIEDIMLDGFTGALGGTLGVMAFDDMEVMSVSVEIRAADQTLLERGLATKAVDKWVYTTTMAHPAGTPITITATAVDRPGNKGSKFTTWS